MPPLTISLVARKGGVGRTTLALNLAAVFAERGASVVLVDLDGQASSSRALLGHSAVDQLDPNQTTAAVLASHQPDPDDILQETPWKGVQLMPACDALERYATPERCDTETALRDCLTAVQAQLVIIDTSPNTHVLTTWTALVASRFVLSPVPPDAFGAQSIISVQRAVADVAVVNPQLSIAGYILNQVEPRESSSRAYIQTIRRVHGGQIFDSEIPRAAAFRQGIASREPVTRLQPRSKAAQSIRALADEIDTRLTQHLERRAA